MNHWLKLSILIPCACLIASCSSSSDKAAKAARQEAPPPAAVAPAPQKSASVPATAAGSGQAQAGPCAEFPTTAHDFGSVSSEKDYVYAFVVRNVGTEELQIKKVLPG